MSAVVIGGSSGIGRECCTRLMGKGYTVYNVSRTPSDNGQVINIVADMSEEISVGKIFSIVSSPDIVIYSAGCSMACPVECADEKDFRYLFEVNYFSALKTLKACAKLMRAGGSGKVIFISSMGAVTPIAFDAFYSCSKAALDMLSKAANIELNPYNVYVTSVRPGGVSTHFTFKRKICPKEIAGVYYDSMNKAATALAEIEQSGMSAAAVADCVMKIVDMKKPPALITAGFVNKSFSLAHKLLPLRLTQFINKNVYLQ